MDQQMQGDKLCQPLRSQLDSRQKQEAEEKDPIAVRKVQKADREKLRRDRLNEQFSELGCTLDPERPKNDKATILTDTIQLLKDLTAEVNRLKAECTALSEESRELTQEKNELREEKASLKTDVENLNMQYQQRVRVMFPWAPMEPVVMGPPYSYPVPVALPQGQIPMHPSMQPYPFYGGNPAAIHNPCPPFMPFLPHAQNPQVEQQSIQHTPTSHVSSKSDSRSKASDSRKDGQLERSECSNDVVTELVLKTPGSAGPQESSSANKKGKRSHKKEKSATDGVSSSKYSCQGPQESSSNSVGPFPKSDK